MSISTKVIGLRDATDPTYLAMVKVVKACAEANVALPDGLAEYFGESDHGWSDAANILKDHLDFPLKVRISVSDWHDTDCDGWEIKVSDIPSGIKTLRVERCA